MRNIFFEILLLFIYLFINLDTIYPKDKNYKDLILYGGKYSETDLLPIMLRAKTDYRDSYIGAVGLNFPMDYRLGILDFEAEVQSVKHFGKMNHFEFNGLYIARINNLFGIPMSIAIGEGMSIASENPKMENKRKGIYFGEYGTDFYTGFSILQNTGWIPGYTKIQEDNIESRNLLNYVMVEVDYGFPKISYYPRIFLRIHHRSGVFGLYCPPDPACGSNFVSYGVKFRFEN